MRLLRSLWVSHKENSLTSTRMGAVWPDLAKFHPVGDILKVYGNLISIYLALVFIWSFFLYWTNYHCCKWTNKIAIWSHCLGDSWMKFFDPNLAWNWLGSTYQPGPIYTNFFFFYRWQCRYPNKGNYLCLICDT